MMNTGLGTWFPAGALHDPPHGFRHAGLRPVSGLAHEAFRLPVLRQWLIETPNNNAYRCGGSTGLAAKAAHLFPVYPAQRKAAPAPEAAHFTCTRRKWHQGQGLVVKTLSRQQRCRGCD
jgi:hypothetical protein